MSALTTESEQKAETPRVAISEESILASMHEEATADDRRRRCPPHPQCQPGAPRPASIRRIQSPRIPALPRHGHRSRASTPSSSPCVHGRLVGAASSPSCDAMQEHVCEDLDADPCPGYY
ncbi:unnamed protein product [Urochloa humidicola]